LRNHRAQKQKRSQLERGFEEVDGTTPEKGCLLEMRKTELQELKQPQPLEGNA